MIRRTELSPYVDSVVPRVDTDDLVDAHEVADILGLAHRNSVSLYQRRYPDMPRPVVERGGGRIKLWLRASMEQWVASRLRGTTSDED